MSVKAVDQPMDDRPNSYHHYADSYHDDYYNTENDDLKPPPLTISHSERLSQAYPSPASIPSPITPGNTTKPKNEPENEVEALVHEGITFHEKGQLEKATSLFRIAAEKENPLGMFLYGVSLRHGWVS